MFQEGDRRVVPLRTCESNIDIPSRRHSRGHTETARGIVMDTFPLASTACAATEN